MDDKCPGCGSAIRTVEGKGTDWETTIYECGTGEDSGFFGRDCWANQCAAKETQITALKAGLREAIEVLTKLTKWADGHYYLTVTGDMIREAAAGCRKLEDLMKEG